MQSPNEHLGPLIDGFLDGELSPDSAREVETHTAACKLCHGELDWRRALKQALSRLALPAPPKRFTLRPVRRVVLRFAPAAAAAVLLVGLLIFFLLPGSVPGAVALASEVHNQYLEGRLTPRAMGLKFAVPGTEYVGQCPCPAELGVSSPFIVYRRGNIPISLLIVESTPQELPTSARRTAQGREYYLFRAKGNNAIVCQSGRLCHVWVSRLDEEELVRTILVTREGRELMAGDRLSLEGVT